MDEKKKRILVVEDEIIIRTSLVMYLDNFNYQVYENETGETALEFLDTNRVDLIIADMRLPGISGEMLINSAYKIDNSIKFIIYTGSLDYTLPKSLKEIGMTDLNIIHKPVYDMNEFIKVIRRLI
ncbi:MAG: response regulator [Spirochaetes bacterium]|nr:response regulator [Spirochaetota bacterium]